MIIKAIIKAAAVGGIALLWGDFTHKAIKICRQIVFPPKLIDLERCEYCTIYFPCNDNSRRWVLNRLIYVYNRCAEKKVVSEECQERFLDDTEELGLDKILCRNCRDI